MTNKRLSLEKEREMRNEESLKWRIFKDGNL